MAIKCDHWKAEITGNDNDLERLARYYPDEVVMECNCYFLTGHSLSSCQEPEEVVELAEERLELINALTTLLSGDDVKRVQDRAATCVDSSGIYHSYVMLTGVARCGAFIEASLEALPGRKTDPELYLLSADQNLPPFTPFSCRFGGLQKSNFKTWSPWLHK